jgi:hypothetical protein
LDWIGGPEGTSQFAARVLGVAAFFAPQSDTVVTQSGQKMAFRDKGE